MNDRERNGTLAHFQSPLVIVSRSCPIREFTPDYVTSVLDVTRFQCIFRSFALRMNDLCSLSIPSAQTSRCHACLDSLLLNRRRSYFQVSISMQSTSSSVRRRGAFNWEFQSSFDACANRPVSGWEFRSDPKYPRSRLREERAVTSNQGYRQYRRTCKLDELA
jgi:hypothetical protein